MVWLWMSGVVTTREQREHYLKQVLRVNPHEALRLLTLIRDREAAAPSTHSYGDIFSAFEPWDSRTTEGPVGNIQEIIERWRAYHKDQ
jgi:16S rRNA U1498 N3-methylase RsmE